MQFISEGRGSWPAGGLGGLLRFRVEVELTTLRTKEDEKAKMGDGWRRLLGFGRLYSQNP